MEYIDKININDNLGFHYEVVIKHYPNLGFSVAIYEDRIIADREYGKINYPLGDDDREWELWEERFAEWSSAVNSDLKIECENYFNKKQS